MEINIKVIPDEEDDLEKTLTITTDGIDNPNYVNIIIDHKEYLVVLKDLEAAIKAFKSLIQR